MSAAASTKTDAEVLRRLEQASAMAEVNLRTAERLAYVEGVLERPSDREAERRRLESYLATARRLASEVELLTALAEERGIWCLGEQDCACARCEEDGPVTALLGDFSNFVVAARGREADGWLGVSAKPRRTMFRLGPDRDGEIVPAHKGERRHEIVGALGGIVRGLRPSSRRGREKGHGLDRSTARAMVDSYRAEGSTAAEAIKKVASEMVFAEETVRSAYYRRK